MEHESETRVGPPPIPVPVPALPLTLPPSPSRRAIKLVAWILVGVVAVVFGIGWRVY